MPYKDINYLLNIQLIHAQLFVLSLNNDAVRFVSSILNSTDFVSSEIVELR